MKTIIAMSLLLLSGCATIFSGTKDSIHFVSKPEGATVLVNGMPSGVTPVVVAVPRSGFQDNIITYKREGFEDVTFVLSKSFNVVSIINLTNILGWGIDAMSGAVMKNEPTRYDISMTQKPAMASKF